MQNRWIRNEHANTIPYLKSNHDHSTPYTDITPSSSNYIPRKKRSTRSRPMSVPRDPRSFPPGAMQAPLSALRTLTRMNREASQVALHVKFLQTGTGQGAKSGRGGTVVRSSISTVRASRMGSECCCCCSDGPRSRDGVEALIAESRRVL